MRLYRKAAEQGVAEAQSNLGAMYAKGLDVPRDYAEALKWFNLATSRSPPGKVHNRMVLARDFLAKRMTPDQIAAAQRLAREWMAKFEARKKKQE